MKRSDLKYYLGLFGSSLCPNYFLRPDQYVFPFEIHEKGKVRSIVTYNEDPNLGGKLRKLHEKLYAFFAANFWQRNPHSFAYQKDTRTLDALQDHLQSEHFIKLDIHHFFESITEEAFFAQYGSRFNANLREILSYCFYKGSLSIGFVSSPILSDYFLSSFDEAMEGYLKEHPGLHYSRYCDDILLSSDCDLLALNEFFEFTKKQLSLLGMELNEAKTRRVSLDYQKHNSLTFLGLNLSKADEQTNKITISKRYILFLLYLIEKNNRYQSKCRELVAEINSRVAYLAYNSPISYNRFQRKHFNRYGVFYDFVAKQASTRKVGDKAEEVVDFSQYPDFVFDIHVTVTDRYTGRRVVNNGVAIKQYRGKGGEVEIPPFVNSISEYAFSRFSIARGKITKVICHEALMAIGRHAFAGQPIEEINLPKSLVYIEEGAFSGCSLKSISIPKNLRIIPENCFERCHELKKVEFAPDTVLTQIRASAFNGTGLEEITLPDSLKALDRRAFSFNESLKRLDLGKGIISIPTECFCGCKGLEQIDIPDNIISIGDIAFASCGELSNIRIGKRLSTFKRSIFKFSTIRHFDVDPANPSFYTRDGRDLIETSTKALVYATEDTVLSEEIEIIGEEVFQNLPLFEADLTHVKQVENSAFEGAYLLRKVTFGNNLVRIAPAAFKGCVSLEEAILPASLRVIESSAFAEDTALARIELNEGLLEIGKHAFAGDSKVQPFTLPKSLRKLGHNAFGGITSVTSLSIGPNLGRFHGNPFFGWSRNLESIEVDPDNMVYGDFGANILVEKKGNRLILGCRNSSVPEGIKTVHRYAFAYAPVLKEIRLPSTVEEIGLGAFIGCPDLAKVTMENVFAIGDSAFKNCHNLSECTIPSSISRLGESAFAGTAIPAIDIPEGLTTIGAFAFANNPALTKITLPSSMNTFQRGWFAYCPNIETILVSEKNRWFHHGKNKNLLLSVDGELLLAGKGAALTDEVREIVRKSFVDYETREEVILPEGCKLHMGAFSHCFGLKKVQLPSDLPAIPDFAFYGCVALEEIKIPESVQALGAYAFAHCAALRGIEIPPNAAFDRSGHQFQGCLALKKATLAELPSAADIHALSSGESLQTNFLPASVFDQCVSLEEVVIPDSNLPLAVMRRGFHGCKKLRLFPDGKRLVRVDESAFEGCSNLSIDLGEALVVAGRRAFYGVTNLRHLHLGSKLHEIGYEAFGKCDLEEIVIDPNNAEYQSKDNCLLDAKGETLILGCKSSTIPAGIVHINDQAFEGSSIAKVRIPSSVQVIGNQAFALCKELRSVEFEDPKELMIEPRAFLGCEVLEELRLVGEKITLDSSAFSGCIGLKRIVLENVRLSGADIFDGIGQNLNEIRATGEEFDPAFADRNAVVTKEGKVHLALASSDLTGAKDIASRAFDSSKGFPETYRVAEGIETIQAAAFCNLPTLTCVYLPKSLSYVASDSFAECPNLKRIVVDPENPEMEFVDEALISKTSKRKIIDFMDTVSELSLSARFKTGLSYSGKYAKTKRFNVDPRNAYYSTDDAHSCIMDKAGECLLLANAASRIPASVRRFENRCFALDPEVKEIKIPSALEFIHPNALEGYPSLERILVEEGNANFMASKDGKALLLKATGEAIIALDGYVPDPLPKLKAWLRKAAMGKGSRLDTFTGFGTFSGEEAPAGGAPVSIDADDLPF